MRKEILGVILVFALIFTAVSLLSYHPSDPSINHAGASGEVQNLFGPVGSHVAGVLVYLFGVGAFWIPVILLITTLNTLKEYSKSAILLTLLGGLLLVVTTGGLLAGFRTHYLIFGRRFSSGGIIGIPLADVVGKYGGSTGGFIFLLSAWTIALIMTTRLSLMALFKWMRGGCAGVCERMGTAWIIWRERRQKAKRRAVVSQKQPPKRKAPVKVIEPTPKRGKEIPRVSQDVFEFVAGSGRFKLPPLDLLEDGESDTKQMDHDSLQMQSKLLEKKLGDFDVSGKVVAVSPGPVVTMYEYEPAPGVKINKVVSLTDDLAMALRATSIRIVAPIPGKAVIGIEVANVDRESVRIKDIIASEAFSKTKSKLTLALGKDILGNPIVADLAKMPHLLIAGATGSGKSVGLNAMICSILYKATPDEVKLVLIDPKRIELAAYEDIPHMISPVVVNARKATQALQWAVQEMERRYTVMAEYKVRNITQYNRKLAKEMGSADKVKKSGDRPEAEAESTPERLPFVVVVIDELADLMLVASRDVELALTRLAQMSRAAGMHLLIATQRPSVDVLTGIIKANFPTRISFQVSSRTDSRTILDANGAETLLGSGDMLFLPPGTSKLQRIHGAYVSESEIRLITEFLKKQREPVYQEEILAIREKDADEAGEDEYDEKYDEAVALVTETGQASISMVQRRLRVGYNRAARMIETMEREGVVGPSDGSKPRDVLVKGYDT
ncbi:MAG: DNA translocase FtsK [Deltaproteobacteria bacterium]|nr:DNA translocase FtsK [Deltaproteobacteria bacterium]